MTSNKNGWKICMKIGRMKKIPKERTIDSGRSNIRNFKNN